MNTSPNTPPKGRPHPLLLVAALAVVMFCAVGTAAILGWLPSSVGGNAERQLTDAERQALAATLPQDGPQPAPGALQDPAMAPAPAQAYAPTAPVQSVKPAPAPAPTPAPARKAEPAPQVAAAESERNWCANCGNVESVRTITTRAEGSGLGAAGGAVVGGLLGNQIGGGSGRQLATVAGAIGGAVAGNQIEGRVKATTSYEIRVRLDDGTLRTFRQDTEPAWRSGDRVRIENGRLRSVA